MERAKPLDLKRGQLGKSYIKLTWRKRARTRIDKRMVLQIKRKRDKKRHGKIASRSRATKWYEIRYGLSMNVGLEEIGE